MICNECATAARVNKERLATLSDLGPVQHPDNCGCPCQHKPVGAWKGKK